MTLTANGHQALEALVGNYGQDWRSGILSDHLRDAEAHGLVIVHMKNGSSWVTYKAVNPALAARVLCSEIVWITTEDGRMDGRCGNPTVDGYACARHALPDVEGTCEHGMSAALCAGPGHYPAEV